MWKQDFLQRYQARLDSKLLENRLLKEDFEPFPVSLTPYCISEEKYHAVSVQCELVLSAIEKIIKRYKTDPFIRNFFSEFFLLDDLIKVDPSYSPWIKIARFDLAEDKNGSFHLMETNCAQPGGAVIIPKIKKVYEGLGLNNILLDSSRVISQKMDDEYFFLKMIMKTYRDSYNANLKHIGFAHSQFNPITTDIEHLVKQSEVMGIKASIFEVEELEIVNGKACVRGEYIDLIHHKFDFFTDVNGQCYPAFMVSKKENIQGYLTAIRESVCPFINPIVSMTLAESKKIISLLQNEMVHQFLDKKEVEAINVLCPRTYVLASSDEEVFNIFLNNKNDYVLKSAYSTRSKSVFIGRELSQNVWREELHSLRHKPTVLQQYIDHPFESIWVDGMQEINTYKSNLAIYLVNGKASGLLCRASRGYKSNFYAGGVCRPAYVMRS